jgi:hypothetical protein
VPVENASAQGADPLGELTLGTQRILGEEKPQFLFEASAGLSGTRLIMQDHQSGIFLIFTSAISGGPILGS